MNSDVEKIHEQAPVVQLVHALVHKAVACFASDIHLEPMIDGMHVRFRIDGMLHVQEPIDVRLMHQVISRLKVLANIDTAERRLAQDGKFAIEYKGREIDFRLATFPAYYGEKIVIRILDRTVHTMTLDSLGLAEQELIIFKEHIRCASGFFLVTGPTGSGKTTTLYAALHEVNDANKHIITLENPVEYNVPGITQGQINPDVGFTFEAGMRALLRQDPDVVMVGEVRDQQTARIAMQAALTGHLVFSTVHTHNAPSVITRLIDMGIEPFLLNATLTGVLAQRLARKLCEHCRSAVVPTDHEKQLLTRYGYSSEHVYVSSGCTQCLGLGYKGRIGLFELLIITDELRALIAQAPTEPHFVKQAQTMGMKTLMHDGMAKVAYGIISMIELMRVIS